MGALGILFLAVGAVLAFALDANVQGIDLETVGFILMIVGGVGVLLGAVQGSFTSFTTRSQRTVSPDGRDVIEEHHTTGM